MKIKLEHVEWVISVDTLMYHIQYICPSTGAFSRRHTLP